MDGQGGLVDEGCRCFRDCYPHSRRRMQAEIRASPISEFDVSTLKMMACLGCAARRYACCSSDSAVRPQNDTGVYVRLLSARLIVSLILGVTLVSLFSTYYEVRREKHGLRNDLERRAEVLGESLVGNVEPYLDERSLKQLQRIVGRFSNREHLVGVAILNTRLEPIAQSSGLDQQLKIQSLAIPEAIANN